MDRVGKYNLQEQLDRDLKEAKKGHKTTVGRWYHVPRQRMDVLVKSNSSLKKVLTNLLESRHNKSIFKQKK